MKRVMSVQDAIREAFQEEMRRDPRVILMGGDVTTSFSGLTAGLIDEFGPQRLIDLPTAEAAMALGITEECVKTRLHRARELLRKRLRRTAARHSPPAYVEPRLCAVN